jgi:ubiquinone/menaquinone biosynthesis C-methylase UbiE
MPINFHDERNRMTYTTRTADESWLALINENTDVSGKEVVDIGCGGGIYTKALASLGASQVTGVDFSEEMLKGASKNCKNLSNVTFMQGNAYNSRLPDNKFDIILERALIHHLNDLNSCFKEANRILKRNGVLIIQDRTPKDCLLPGDENHIRGYFFEKYPKLIDKEISRRHESGEVRISLESNGFTVTKEVQLWETRRAYNDFNTLNNDLMQRTGRSILHELTDNELNELIVFINSKLKNSVTPIIEKDSWTLWFAVKK